MYFDGLGCLAKKANLMKYVYRFHIRFAKAKGNKYMYTTLFLNYCEIKYKKKVSHYALCIISLLKPCQSPYLTLKVVSFN